MVEALSADQVAQVVSFIAPGFVARLAYAGRFQRPEPPQVTFVVTSVVLSLPLVSVSRALARGLGISYADVTGLPYMVLLFGVSFLAGYLWAVVRVRPWTRAVLGKIGLFYQPESSIYAQTLLALPPDAVVTVECTDGRKVSGTPRIGPGLVGAGVDELYLTNPAWWEPRTGSWVEQGVGGGVILPLRNVHSVTLDRDPT